MNFVPLEKFREVIDYNPFHFWQLTNDKVPVNSACETLVREYAWQNVGAAGRTDMRRALNKAVDDAFTYLQYYPVNRYFTESVPITCFQHFNRQSFFSFFPFYLCDNPDTIIKLQNQHITALQTETITALGAPVTPTVTDDDGDGLIDTFTATLVDSTSDPAALTVCFLDMDCKLNATFDEKIIAPVTIVRLNSTTIQVTGPAWILVKPRNYQGFSIDNQNGFNPNTTTIYAQQIQFYITTVSALNSVVSSYVDSSGVTQTQTLNASLCDPENGLIGVYNQNCNFPCTCNAKYSPKVIVNYRAGDDLDDWLIDLVHLAIADLEKKICACDSWNRVIGYWQTDLSLPVGPGLARISVDPSTLKNPLGMRRGQVDFWQKIQVNHGQRGISI